MIDITTTVPTPVLYSQSGPGPFHSLIMERASDKPQGRSYLSGLYFSEKSRRGAEHSSIPCWLKNIFKSMSNDCGRTRSYSRLSRAYSTPICNDSMQEKLPCLTKSRAARNCVACNKDQFLSLSLKTEICKALVT